MDRKTGFWLGTVIGVIVGAASSLLYAPKPGTETRKDIQEKLKEVGEKAEQAWERTKERTSDFVEEAKERARDICEKGKSAAQEIGKRLSEEVEAKCEANEEEHQQTKRKNKQSEET